MITQPDDYEFKVLVIDPNAESHLLLFENGNCWGAENVANNFYPESGRTTMRAFLVQKIADDPEDGEINYPGVGRWMWERWTGAE